MTDEQIRKIIDDPRAYEDARENTVRSMLGDFYNRKMLSTAIFVWVWGLAVMAGAAYCGVQFFRNVETRDHIMYAAIFIPCVLSIGFMKVFAWEMVNRHSIKREIKRLELRIADLAKSLDKAG